MPVEFTLTDGQKNIREFLHWFAREKIRPRAAEADRLETVPDDLLLEMKQMGMSMDRTVPSDAGRAGGTGEKQSNRNSVISTEELAWGDAAITMTLPGAGLGGPPVQAFGTPEQRERFFSVFRAEEPRWGAYATTEPECGSDVAGIRMLALKDGDHYILKGTKTFITNGNRASWVVVFATVDPKLGRAGHRPFVVERGTPGFIQGKKIKKMGLRASDTAELVFDECRVHKDNLLGGEEAYGLGGRSGGFRVAMATFDATRPIVAAMGIGIARAAFEYTRDWLRSQYSLGRPIPRYQQMKEKLAEMERKLTTARLLTWRAAWMADVGRPNSKEASMCKAYMGKVAVEVCADCVDLLGDSGTTREHPVERWFRDIKVFDIFEGTGQVNRLVVARRTYEPFGVSI